MMTESILDRVELTAIAKPGIIELSARVDSTGCTDLRRIHILFSNHGHPSWPKQVEVIYGWRGLTRLLDLKTVNNNGSASYIINNDILYEMNLLDPPFYVKDVVNVKVEFSQDVIIHSMPFRIASANTPYNKNNDHQNLSSHGGGGNGNGGGNEGNDDNQMNDNQSNSSWGHTMARAWDGSQRGESEFEDEGWDSNMDSRRCWIGCCTPCYSTCQCLWHICRSTPATSLLSFGLAIAVICIYNFYVPIVKHELDDAGLILQTKLFDMLRTMSVVILVLDGVYVITSALLMGTTKEIICASIYTGELQYSPDKKWKCALFARILRNFGGMTFIKFLVISSFAAICLAGFLLFTTTVAWYSAHLASISCNFDDDDTLNASETDNLFQLYDKALVWTNFVGFSYQAYCIDQSTYVPNVNLKREESIYQHLIIILMANGALVIGQAMFFTLMVDNHRVASFAAAQYESETIGYLSHHGEESDLPNNESDQCNQIDDPQRNYYNQSSQGRGGRRGEYINPNSNERPLISESSEFS